MHPTEYCSNVTQGGTLRPGVVYVGHIPHGFYEEEMRKYFSQFGTVTRLRLARSRKVGTLRLAFTKLTLAHCMPSILTEWTIQRLCVHRV